MKNNYDMIVIGAGSGGLTTAVGLSKIGKKVLLIEKDKIGGECTNSGCIPSKALLHHSKEYFKAVSISGTNGNTENYRRQALTYVRDKIAETLATETPAHFKNLGIDVIMGEAIFSSPSTITVGTDIYHFKKAIITSGSSPRTIDIPGLTEDQTLTNQNIFLQSSIPARTLIVGAGPIGMEIGQAFAMLGSKVTILDNGPQFANKEDSSVATIIKKQLVDLGVTILQNSQLQTVEGGSAFIQTDNQTNLTEIPFDKVLLAIGRVPNLPQGLELAGVDSTAAGITVNHNYQTTNKKIYALGDVSDRMKFTHVADDVARQVVTRIASFGLISVKQKAIPKVTYTEPEMAQVGLSETEALENYGAKNIHRIEVLYTHNDRARTDNNTNGAAVVIATRLSGRVLGAHIIGQNAGELISIFTIAIDQKISLWKLRNTIYAYPTYSLLIKKIGDVFFATQIKTLRIDIWNKIKSTLPKLAFILLWAGILIAFQQYQTSTGQTTSEILLNIFLLITTSFWGPLLYVLLYTARPIVLIPGTVMTVLSGIFFGLWGGIIYTVLGANLSATLTYLIGRLFSQKNKLKQPKFISRLAETLNNKPFTAILTTRLLYLPYDAVNYGAGFLRVPYLPYIFATLIGTLLGIASFVSLGASISLSEYLQNGISTNVVNAKFISLSAIIFIGSLALSKIINRLQKK